MKDLIESPKKFRPELEGIRAVAALLVACFHIWLGKVSGGVDVFFVVSGYLITSGLVSKITQDGSINFFENYLNLAKRLFPLALLVALTTAVGSFVLLSSSTWVQISREMIASIFYFENWRLAFDSIDYLAQTNVASPFQHYWALSIQGQFYITWPILLVVVYLLATKLLKTPVKKTLLYVLVTLFILSFCYSIYSTAINQPFAYFNTFARVWEFCLGGILYLLLPYFRPAKWISFAIGWLGLLTILLTGVLLPVSNLFPGYVALLPTVAVLLIIISAETSTKYGVSKLLSTPLFQWFGSISYGFYLWHWPLLIFYYAIFDVEAVPFLHGVVILSITLVFSVVSIKLAEKPIRSLSFQKHKKKLVSLLGSSFISVLIVALAWIVYIDYEESKQSVTQAKTSNYPGALALTEDVTFDNLAPIPALINLKRDLPAFNTDPSCETGVISDDEVGICYYGNTTNPELKLALVGGSHSGHWFPALLPIIEKYNWRLDVYYMDGCRLSTQDFGFFTDECLQWNELVVPTLMKQDVDAVFTTANVNKQDFIPEGYIEQWKRLNEDNIPLIAIRDNPRTLEDPLKCLEENSQGCSSLQTQVLSENLPWLNDTRIPENVHFIDMSNYFCSEGECPQVIGNVIVYRDLHHISNTYSQTLSLPLEQKLLPILQQIK